MTPYEIPASDADLLASGVRIEPEDYERFPFQPHAHGPRSPFPECPGCIQAIADRAVARRNAEQAAKERRELEERLAIERDAFFAKCREDYARRERKLRSAPMPPDVPPPHPLAPLRCVICGRVPGLHTIAANGALLCWPSAQEQPREATDND